MNRLYRAVVTLAEPERSRALDRACGGNAALRAAVAALFTDAGSSRDLTTGPSAPDAEGVRQEPVGPASAPAGDATEATAWRSRLEAARAAQGERGSDGSR